MFPYQGTNALAVFVEEHSTAVIYHLLRRKIIRAVLAKMAWKIRGQKGVDGA